MTKLSKDLQEAAEKFDKFDASVKEMTLDQMNMAPKQEVESQSDFLKISQKEKDAKGEICLKPERTIGCKELFNEKFREEYNYKKELVKFEAENIEIIGEAIEVWTKKFPGQPAEFWKIPVNTPVWGPRYLAEQLASRQYHRLVMKEGSITGSDRTGQYFGSMAADTTINRLNARPVSTRKSIFMGASGF